MDKDEMKLVNKHKINYNDKYYLIDVQKIYDDYINGKDYYKYLVTIYDSNVKVYHGIKSLWFGKYVYTKICDYQTYWLDYFNYNGDIDKVIKEALNKMDWNLREQKYISQKENVWKESDD